MCQNKRWKSTVDASQLASAICRPVTIQHIGSQNPAHEPGLPVQCSLVQMLPVQINKSCSYLSNLAILEFFVPTHSLMLFCSTLHLDCQLALLNRTGENTLQCGCSVLLTESFQPQCRSLTSVMLLASAGNVTERLKRLKVHTNPTPKCSKRQ